MRTDEIHDFGRFLAELRYGATMLEVEGALREVAKAVEATGKSGTLTLKLTLTPTKGNRSQIRVNDTVTAKKPEEERLETTLFVLADGTLSTRDPRQPDLGALREVTRPNSETREVRNA